MNKFGGDFLDTLTIILNLMQKNNCDNLTLANALGLNRQVVTDWKAKRSKSYNKYLPQIADYFGVSVDYLLGKEQEKKTPSKVLSSSFLFTPQETALVIAYRTHPNEQAAVNKLLDVPTCPDEILLYNAAYLGEKGSEGFVTMPADEWEQLKNTPATDQDLS